jgi:8-oxo-dGTP diphosphatase
MASINSLGRGDKMGKQFFFATKALIIENRKFLAMYKIINGKKYWDLPGGRMEFGENAEETLSRELKEELSLVIKPIKLIDTWNYMVNDNFQITGVIYHCEVISGDIRISPEHDGYKWINISDVGKIFDREIFVERMRTWNWKFVTDSNVRLNNCILKNH